MNRSFAAPVLLLGLLLGSTVAAAHEQTEKRDGVSAQLRAESIPVPPQSAEGRLGVSLSGELVVTVIIETPREVEVAALPIMTAAKMWRQRNTVTGWESTALQDGRVRRRQNYRLTPWQPGEAELPLLPLRFRKERGPNDWEEIVFKPIPVIVTTMLQDAHLANARAITGIEALPTDTQGDGWLLGLTGGVAAAIVGTVAWILWRRRTWPTPVPAPAETALEQLTRLAERPLQTLAEVEAFSRDLSEVLRRYLEERFGYQAPQQTTSEFLGAARQAPHLTPQQQELLRAVLQQCDLAKFARVQVPAAECRQGVAQVRRFVEETRPPQPSG